MFAQPPIRSLLGIIVAGSYEHVYTAVLVFFLASKNSAHPSMVQKGTIGPVKLANIPQVPTTHCGNIRVTLRLYWDNGKDNGYYHSI